MSKRLFQEFDKASSKSWKQKIQVDLKGADYNDTLIWQTAENITVKPFYHPDEFNPKDFSSLKSQGTWLVGQSIIVKDELEANSSAKDAISRGAEALVFKIQKDALSIETLLKDLDNVPVSISGWTQPENTGNSVNFYFDPIGQLATQGNWFKSLSSDMKQLELSVEQSGSLVLDMAFYQNAGANMVQQLAYSLSHINEYLNQLNKNDGYDFKNLKLHLNIGVGGNYFFEIAKLRAMRLLWQTLSKVYGAPTDCSISAVPSRRNKSIYDYNVNMLRTTTECMSAILGGADIIYNEPYDALYQESNEFGDRISRNQLLILKHESYFDQVQNPSDGAYYIESLTEQLADKALDLFKSIENSGGFIQQLMSGTIQRKIKESAQSEQSKFNSGELVLLGVNTFPNEQDTMKNNLEIDPFLTVSKRKTLIQPIIQKRLSEKLEKSRLEKE